MPASNEDVIKHYGEGLQSFYREDYQAAVINLSTAVEARPDSPTLHNDLAAACWSLGDKDKAKSHWLTALKLDPANTSVIQSLVTIYVDEGDVERARELCGDFVRENPSEVQIVNLMNSLTEVPSSATEASQLMDEADALIRAGQEEEGFQIYLKVAELAPLEKADAARYASYYLDLYLKEHKDVYQLCEKEGTLEERNCPICGSHNAEVALHGTIGTKYRMCSSCDVMYMSPIVSMEMLDKVYSEHETSCKVLMWTHNRKHLKRFDTPPRSFPERIHKIREHCPSGQLLDFGSSLGGLLNYAKFFFDVAGVEIDPVTSNFSKEVLGLKEIYNQDVFDPSLDAHLKGRFDVVTLIQVIEHLTDPTSILTRLKDFMKPGGHIFIECPNYRSTSIEWFGANQHLLMGIEHVVMFSRSSLGKLLESLGFEIVISETFQLDIEVYDIIAKYLRSEYGQFCLHRHGARSNKALAEFGEINKFLTNAISQALQSNPDHGSYLRVMGRLKS